MSSISLMVASPFASSDMYTRLLGIALGASGVSVCQSLSGFFQFLWLVGCARIFPSDESLSPGLPYCPSSAETLLLLSLVPGSRLSLLVFGLGYGLAGGDFLLLRDFAFS
jgi:hypothetical protein